VSKIRGQVSWNETVYVFFSESYDHAAVPAAHYPFRYRQRFSFHWENLHENEIFDFVDREDRAVSVFGLFGSYTSEVQGIVLFHLKETS
jgi:hypothetical protein